MEVQWSLVLFTTLVGLGCWCFVCVAVDEFVGKAKATALVASVIAAVALAVGGFASMTHLSHPGRIMEALSVPTSSIFIEAAGVFIIAALIVVFFILKQREAAPKVATVVAVLAALVAVALSFAMGNSYVMGAREAWDTLTLPLAYLGSAMVLGVAAFVVIAALKKVGEEGIAFYGRLLGIAGIVALACVAAYALASGIAGNADVAVLLWGGAVVVGCVCPAVLGFVAAKAPAKATALVVVALIAALVGAIAFRVMMWQVGVSTINFFGIL